MGIDPGTTTGIAVLSADGTILSLMSSKDLGISKIIQFVLEHGVPIIVACDKKKMPYVVDKVSASLGAKRYCPENDLSVLEKKSITSYIKYDGDHERDALAGALYAHKQYEHLILKIMNTADKYLDGLFTSKSPDRRESVEIINRKTEDIKISVMQEVIINETAISTAYKKIVSYYASIDSSNDKSILENVKIDSKDNIIRFSAERITELKRINSTLEKKCIRLSKNNEKLKDKIKDIQTRGLDNFLKNIENKAAQKYKSVKKNLKTAQDKCDNLDRTNKILKTGVQSLLGYLDLKKCIVVRKNTFEGDYVFFSRPESIKPQRLQGKKLITVHEIRKLSTKLPQVLKSSIKIIYEDDRYLIFRTPVEKAKDIFRRVMRDYEKS